MLFRSLMIGVDIEGASSEVQKKALEAGLLMSTAGKNTLRFLPPLVITDDEIEQGLKILKNVLESF